MDTASEPNPKPDLASEPDFRLGALEVSPSGCRVRSATADRRVEPRVMEVLLVLVRAEGRTVSRDQLIDTCWDGRIVSDDAIARIIAKVRALAPLSHPPAFELETIPKVGFRLAAAPAPDRAPVAAPAAASPPSPAPRSALGRRAMTAVAGLAVLLLAGAMLLWRPWDAATGQNGRVEVVGFEARESDAEIRRIAAGAAEAVIQVLTRGGIDTVSRVGEPDQGSGSDAEFRVVGSVSRDAEGLALNTQVLDRRTGMVLLSNHFVRQGSPAGLAEQGAQGVASALSCALEDRERAHRRMGPEVLSLYLNACDAVSREGNMRRMLETTRRLAAEASDLGIVHALYAIAQGNAAQGMGGEGPEAEALRRGARTSAERAIRMDSRNPKAHLAMAQSYPAGANWMERERALTKAHELDPNMGPGRMSYVILLREVGRLEDARAVVHQLMFSSDPRVNSNALIPGAFLAAQTGDPGAAGNYLAALDRMDPQMGRGIRWQVMQSWAEPAEALAQIEAMGPENINRQSYACVGRFLRELHQRIASRATGLPDECARIPAERRIRMLARQGDVDSAYAAFARLTTSERSFPGFIFYPEMKAFRADPRFPALVRQLGLVDYWTKSGKWPDFCREPALPYDCRALGRS